MIRTGVARQVRPQLAFLLAAAVLTAASLSVLATGGYWSAPSRVAPAVLADLSLGLPALGYFFLVRGRVSGAWILLPLLGGGLLLSRWLIPAQHMQLPAARVLLAATEFVIFGYLVLRMGAFVSEFRSSRALGSPPSAAFESALSTVVGPRVGGVVFTELAMLWYSILGLRARGPLRDGSFSTHRRGGYPAVLAALVVVIGIETAAAHLLLELWSTPMAWVSTGLGLYSALWLIGHYNAARLNPIVAGDEGLHLVIGLRWRAYVAWPDVVRVHLRAPSEKYARLTILGEPDLWLELQRPIEVAGPFGSRRTANVLGIGVDDPKEFVRLLHDRLNDAHAAGVDNATA